ncbi:MAG TPA: alpha/beta fold hydrolase [Woeseiaceae bacterium]|nr:alpha/beta fold hydrolase [Woeseiaceae bacterium]
MNQTTISPPPPLLGLLEVRAPLEGLGLAAFWPWIAFVPRGDGRPVVLAPGYGASDVSMYPLYRYLKCLGYDVHHWGLGRNQGKVTHYVATLKVHVRELHESAGETVTLIGWSLGGVVMREIAREAPELVREVITMGTPIVGGPKYTRVGEEFAKRENLDLDRFEIAAHERNMEGIRCPVTSIYSKTDGVVSWRASIDRYNSQARNIRVPGSHLGLGFNPAVWRVIATTLGRKDG